MLDLARQKNMSITEDSIKKLHHLFYQKVDAAQAGQYRTVQVSIPGNGATGSSDSLFMEHAAPC